MKKIKVLQYVGGLNRAGAETMVMNIYRKFDRDKFEFYFACHENKKYDYEDEVESLGGHIIRIKAPQFQKQSIFEKEFADINKQYGPFDVVHSHINLMNSVVLKYAAKNNIRIRVSHSHSNKSLVKESIQRKVYNYLSSKMINKYSTCKLACSYEAGEFMYRGKDFKVINNAINLDDYKSCTNESIKKELNISESSKLIVHVGRFIDVKNHKFLIEVFNDLLKKEHNMHLILCGEGELFTEVKDQVKDLGIEKNVHFMGIRNDINMILQQSDIFVMPSKVEGIPLAVIEAQAARCVCVISDQIPKEVDIKAGLINFLPINKGLEIWVTKILNELNVSKKDFIFIEEKMKEAGYDLSLNVDFLEKIYSDN
ncbi:MAG: glycosyltransferase [Sarcina sp.]